LREVPESIPVPQSVDKRQKKNLWCTIGFGVLKVVSMLHRCRPFARLSNYRDQGIHLEGSQER
jgi:hypothetical protein